MEHPRSALAAYLAELDISTGIDRLETVLRNRMHAKRESRSRVDVVGLARWARANPTSMNVQRLAEAASVSRQHLKRVFQQVIGVTPKRYCRLVRFQNGLAYAGAGARIAWAQVASDLGYSDQSHMIAEFRELTSLTPETLAAQRWFHPFILEAQSRIRTNPTNGSR